MANPDRPLSYRLRPDARYHRLSKGRSVLVLGFPLRTAFIHPTWRPVLALLADGRWVPLGRLIAAVPRIGAQSLSLMLNTLVRKGYVEQRGCPLLEARDCPAASVIIPVRNRPGEIKACLESLLRLDYPAAKLEIIVVDDASTDPTPEIVTRYPNVRLLQMNRHRGASYCRNRGADGANGEILAFIDSDCIADPTWLNALMPAFGDPTLGAVGGWVDAALEENGLDRYERVKSSLNMGAWFKRSGERERFFYVPACNFLVRRKVFAELGGFRESLHVGEDVDFCWRLQDAGHAMEYRPVGRVAHKHRNHLAAFCTRRFQYGTSEPLLQKLHARRVKTLYLPWAESLFWCTVSLALLMASAWPLAVGAGIYVADGLNKHANLKKRQLPVGRRQVFSAILRGYLAFAYHLCSFVSRYYLIALPLIAFFSPWLTGIVLLMHLAAGCVAYAVNRPRLNPFSFLFFFSLEQIAYQSGVWWACLRRANFRPVLPRIVHKQA